VKIQIRKGAASWTINKKEEVAEICGTYGFDMTGEFDLTG